MDSYRNDKSRSAGRLGAAHPASTGASGVAALFRHTRLVSVGMGLVFGAVTLVLIRVLPEIFWMQVVMVCVLSVALVVVCWWIGRTIMPGFDIFDRWFMAGFLAAFVSLMVAFVTPECERNNGGCAAPRHPVHHVK